MFSFGLLKKIAVCALIVSAASACRFWQSNGTATPSPTPFTIEEIESDVPFATKEPEVFQAEFVTVTNGEERAVFRARDGAKRRTDYNFGAENQLTILTTGKVYLILPQQKIYAENEAAQSANGTDEKTNFLTNEWLNAKTAADFEKLETVENITKYRVVLDEKTVSESVIFYDETLKMPVKQEFYSVNGEQKTLLYAFEIRNLKLEADAGLFAVPPDFKKVSPEELRRKLN